MSSIAGGQILVPSGTQVRKSAVAQIAVAGLLRAAIGMYFCVDSRYPALLKKLHSGKNIHVTGAPRLPRTALSPESEQWLAWGQHRCRRQFR